MTELDRVVGDQTVVARDQFQRQFALAHTGVALSSTPMLSIAA